MDNMENMDQELDEIRRLLGVEAPKPSKKAKSAEPMTDNAFNLDHLINEIGGVVDRTAKENAKTPVEIPVSLDYIDVKNLVDQEEAPIEPMEAVRMADFPMRQAAPVQPARQTAPQGMQQQTISPRMDPSTQVLSSTQPQQAVPPTGARKVADSTMSFDDVEYPDEKVGKRRGPAKRNWEEPEKYEEPEVQVRDPHVSMRMSVARSRNLTLRSGMVLVVGLLLLYMSVANSLSLPISAAMDFANNTRSAVMIMLGLQVLAMVLAIDVVGDGFYNLFRGKAERTSLVTCACMASLLHMACMLLVSWAPYLPYASISVLLLCFSLAEEKNRSAGRARAYKAAAQMSSPYTVVAHSDQVDDTLRAVKRQATDSKDFLVAMERPDVVDKFSRIYVPIMLIGAVVFSVVSCFKRGDYGSFFWTLSAILSMATPLPLICAFGKAYANATKRMMATGAAMASGNAAQDLRRAREAIVTDADLFPEGTISIKEVQVMDGTHAPEKLLAYAAAAAEACNISMATALSAATKEQFGRPIQAQDPQTYESGGISAMMMGEAFLMGTAAFLSRMGVTVVEERGAGIVMFMAVNGQYAGFIRMKYHPASATYHSLQSMAQQGVRPVLAQYDCNISAQMIERQFEVKRGTVGEIQADLVAAVRAKNYGANQPIGVLLARDNLLGMAQVLLSADRLSCALRSNLILGAFAGACGSLLMFYLTFLSVFEAIVPLNVAIYLLLWYIPAALVTLHAGKSV